VFCKVRKNFGNWKRDNDCNSGSLKTKNTNIRNDCIKQKRYCFMQCSCNCLKNRIRCWLAAIKRKCCSSTCCPTALKPRSRKRNTWLVIYLRDESDWLSAFLTYPEATLYKTGFRHSLIRRQIYSAMNSLVLVCIDRHAGHEYLYRNMPESHGSKWSLRPFNVIINILFSVLQEAVKRILKQKSHPYEVYNKRYKVIKSHIFHVRP